jgi:hypothetical protein
MYLCVKVIDVASYYDFDDSHDRMVVGRYYKEYVKQNIPPD